MTPSLNKIAKRTRYDLFKRTKMENFRLLNERYARNGQTVLFGDSITEFLTGTSCLKASPVRQGNPSTTAASAVTRATAF